MVPTSNPLTLEGVVSEAERGNQTLAGMVAAHPEYTSELTRRWKEIEWTRAERRSRQFAVEMFGMLVQG